MNFYEIDMTSSYQSLFSDSKRVVNTKENKFFTKLIFGNIYPFILLYEETKIYY